MALALFQKPNKLGGLGAAVQILCAVLAFALAALLPAQAAPAAKAADAGNILLLTIHEGGKEGVVAVKLRPDLAPAHIAQIKKLALAGAYDNVVFHRVIDGFMAQTGDVRYGNRNGYDAARVGTGGSQYADIPAEFSSEPFKRGTVGMARAQDPDSANSQFFICYGDAAFLNGQYTVIGQVVKGMEVIDRLKKGSAADNGKVEGSPDYIVTARLAASAS